MRLINLFFILFFLFLPILVYSQDSQRDPFESLLPEEEVKTQTDEEGKIEVSAPLSVTLEGVLWGTDTPRAIIDGEVYKVGDTLKDVDASVFRITENVVFISYGEKIYKLKTGKGSREEYFE